MVKLRKKTDLMSTLIKIRLLSQLGKKSYWHLKRLLGFWPHDMRPYQLALRHKSINANFTPNQKKKDGIQIARNNERLEFLGDAILGAIVADILFKKYRDKQEGFLTTLRSKIVCRRSLNHLSEEIGLDKLLLHTNDANKAFNSYINGNAFEAFIGAIYIDRGYKYCYKFIEKEIFGRHINTEKLNSNDDNYKSKLIEWCQKNQYKIQFTYNEKRKNNGPIFYCRVSIEGIECGEGQGYKKIESDQNACKDALQKMKYNNSLQEEIEKTVEKRKLEALEQSRRDKTISKLTGRNTIIFDLDGTLMDTLQDLHLSTNYALQTCGYRERTIDEVRQMVGNGIRMLIHRAMPKEITNNETPESRKAEEECLRAFEEHYLEHCQDNTNLYPGIQDLLVSLKEEGYQMAIVSNKLQAGVTELHEKWFKDTIDVAIGESEGVQKKPAPDMVELALRQLGVSADDAIYIGDSDVDIQTAANSGLPCISVLWGFRSKEFLSKHGSTLMVEKPDDILDILHKSN